MFRNKHAGLKDSMGNDLPDKPKARHCLQGHLCPDSQSGQLQVDSPTAQRVSTMMFLHHCISLGWSTNWYIGDISNAFLQGVPLTGEDASTQTRLAWTEIQSTAETIAETIETSLW